MIRLAPGGRFARCVGVVLILSALCSGAVGQAPTPPALATQAPPPPAPVINVAPAPAPVVNVTVPPQPPRGFWETWLPVLVAMLSAGVAFVSLMLNWRVQRFGFSKDAAAVIRELRARHTTAAMQVFENNVARPTGMALDLLERLVGDILRTARVAAELLVQETESRSALLVAEYASALRLCTEADGGLSGAERHPFQLALAGSELDSALTAALREALSQPAHIRTEFATLLASLAEFKVEARRLLEREREAERQRWTGDLRQDPFYPQMQRWLNANQLNRLLGPLEGRSA